MSKKIIAVVLTAMLLFASVCIPAGAADGEEFTPALSYTKTESITIYQKYTLTDSVISPFGVDVKVNDQNIVALDGASSQHSFEVVSITSQRDGSEAVAYDPENPEPFLDIFRFEEGEERKDLDIKVTLKFDFASEEVFGELGYDITINGFSAPPDLGIPGIGDMVAVPTAISATGTISEFPALSTLSIANPPTKKFYTDDEKPQLDGVSVNVTTSQGKSGVVTYGPDNAHMFTTLPDKNEKLVVGTESIATFFFGKTISTVPVSVEHAWSTGFVSITTDKYSETKPGYHARVCNGCGETHSAANHIPDDANWKSNEDQSFVGNGTESTTCIDCGATLTRDVFGSADYNDAFANYHFLRVIFDYINLILRLINGAVGTV